MNHNGHSYAFDVKAVAKSAEYEQPIMINFCHQRSLRASDGTLNTSLLHALEQDYYKRLRFERRKVSFLLGRHAAKRAVSAYANVHDLQEIGIGNGIFQQPVVNCPSSNVQISISHSHEWGAALAFSELLMAGIDIEKRETGREALFKGQLTGHERLLAARLPASEDGPLLLWTVKESLSKVLKTGFAVSPDIFEVAHIEAGDQCFVSSFVHFPVYKALTFALEDYKCSITYPGNAELQIDILRLRSEFSRIQNRI